MDNDALYTSSNADDWSVIRENLTSHKAKTAYQWVFVVVMAIGNLAFLDNLSSLFLGFAWLVFTLGWMLCMLLGYSLLTTKEDKEADEKRSYAPRNRDQPFFSSSRSYWICAGSWVVAMVCSLFVFVGGNEKEEAIFVRDSLRISVWEINSEFHPFFYVPLLDRVTQYHTQFAVHGTCTAQTVDGPFVQVQIAAQNVALNLSDLKNTRANFDSQSSLEQVALKNLCGQTKKVIGMYTLSALPPTLVIEHKTGSDTKIMEDIGLRFVGVINVSGIHAIAGK